MKVESKGRIARSALAGHLVVLLVSRLTAASAVLQQRRRPPLDVRRSSVETSLKELRDALATADDDSALAALDEVRQITAKLKRPAVKVDKDVDAAHLQAEGGIDGLKHEVSEIHTQLPGSCLFDDQLFGLTVASKAELAAELSSPSMLQAVDWIRGGGWWSCGAEGRICKCWGHVRMMSIDRDQLGQIVDAMALGGQVECHGQTFGASRPAAVPWPPVLSASCECLSRPAAGNGSQIQTDDFHLQKRFSSSSLLQEGYIFLLRLLGRTSLLPLGTGDRVYSGFENYIKRSGDDGGHGRSHPWSIPARFWITKFIREFVAPVVKGQGRCLEWGSGEDPRRAFTYTKLVPGCTNEYNIQFDSTYYHGTPMHMAGKIVYSDILSLPGVLGSIKMDAIFATQVFEHLADPMRAAEALFGATAPGGLVVFSAPQQAQFHKIPHDYYRYTIEGAKYVFVKAGFCVPNWGFAGGGDFIFDMARDSGMLLQDFPMEEIEAAFQRGYDKVSHSAINIHMLAFKPPHGQCADPTAGWAELGREGMRA